MHFKKQPEQAPLLILFLCPLWFAGGLAFGFQQSNQMLTAPASPRLFEYTVAARHQSLPVAKDTRLVGLVQPRRHDRIGPVTVAHISLKRAQGSL